MIGEWGWSKALVLLQGLRRAILCCCQTWWFHRQGSSRAALPRWISLPAAAEDACQQVQFGAELLAKDKTLAPKTVNASTRICVLMGRQYWEAPEDGGICRNRRHAHMTLGKVAQLMADGKMEMVAGVFTNERGEEVPTWIPVARFVNARRWRPEVSKGLGAPMMVLQLVPGG